MFKRYAKPVLPLSAAALVLVVVVSMLGCRLSFAQEKRPQRGSVTFGATQKPQIQTSPQFSAFKNMFADVAAKVIPSVVSITTTKMDTITNQNPFNQFFYGSPFDDFFGAPRQQHPQQQRQIIPRTGVGSGVIVSSEGHIITNYHVVGEADEITIVMSDERRFDAEIIGADSLSDIAVIKIKQKVADLPVAYIGDSQKLRPGDWVMAVGNPFNLSSTVTTGIVSALGRQTGGGISYQDFIQTDAAINPGNSGGALVNIEGELVGINSMIYSQSGGYMGIGFAIPINMARSIMEQLIYSGTVSRGWLGVSIQDVDPATAEAMGLESHKGVLIGDVFKGQPADKAGIKRGDVVVSIDGKKVDDSNQLRNTVATIPAGQSVPVELIRRNKKMTLKVTISERDEKTVAQAGASEEGQQPEDQREIDAGKMLGLRLGELSAELRQKLNIERAAKGVVVLDVEQNGAAARNGIKQYDVILEYNQQPVETLGDFKQINKGVKENQPVLFLIQRGNNTLYVAFKLR